MQIHHPSDMECQPSAGMIGIEDTSTVITGDPYNIQKRINYVKLGICVLGIYSSYLYYGSLQEDVFTFIPSRHSSKFTAVWFLQFLEAAANAILASIGFALWSMISTNECTKIHRGIQPDWGRVVTHPLGKEGLATNRNTIHSTKMTRRIVSYCGSLTCSVFSTVVSCPRHGSSRFKMRKQIYFCICGLTQVTSKAFMSMSLVSGVSFPVVILGKSAKCAPVMLAQLAFDTKRYTVRQYIQVTAVICGTALVSFGATSSNTITTTNDESSSSSASTRLGLLFILVSLICDGITGGFQNKLKEYLNVDATSGTVSFQLMVNTNMYMAIIAAIISFLVVQDGYDGWLYCTQQAQVLRLICRFV